MLQLVSRKRTPDRQAWVRPIVTVEGDTPEKGLINTLELGNYPRYAETGEKVIYTPLKEELYVLDYLMVVHEEGTVPTFQQVKEAFAKVPEEIQSRTYAFEFHHGFYDFAATDFFDLAEESKWVSFFALLTKENTGKALPGIKCHLERPIGISDEQWQELYRKYSDPYYGYIDP